MDELATGIDMASVIGSNVAGLVVEQWKKEGTHPKAVRRILSQ
jgi:hypothetical protein